MSRGKSSALRSLFGLQPLDDLIDVKHASAPNTAAKALQCRPETGFRRQIGIGSEIRVPTALGQHGRALLGIELGLGVAHQIDGAFKVLRSMMMRMRSSSRTPESGPPANASGTTSPMHAPWPGM